MQRRRFLGVAVALATMGTLAGCGFRLRSSQEFNFTTIALTGAAGSAVAADLIRYLGARVVPMNSAPGAVDPQVILDILREQREKTVVAVNASGQVREMQLRLRLRMQVRSSDGRELIAATDMVQQRDISFNETAALAKEAEEILLYRDMQTDIVQQILRRLAAIKQIEPAA